MNPINSSLLRIELISFWITERDVVPPAFVISAGISSVPDDIQIFIFSVAVLRPEEI
jgi:hypothetical protein